MEQTTLPVREPAPAARAVPRRDRTVPAAIVVPAPDPAGAVDVIVPPRKRGRPRDPEVDGRILTAASRLLLERGYEAMTVDEVAARARVGKATVYRRWARKEDLAVAAMEQLYRAEIPLPDTGTLHADLVLVYAGLLAFAHTELGRNYLRLTIAESLRDHRAARLYQAAARSIEASAVAIFERAIARGEVRPDVPVAWSMQWLLGLVVTAIVGDREPPHPDDADALAAMMLRGIGTR